MGTRGRKSGSELATQAQMPPERQERPSPPVELNSEQCDVWWEVLNDYPPEQFKGGQLTMLADFCKHTVTQRRISQLVEASMNDEDFDVKSFTRLIEQQRKESATKVTIARALGIAQKSVYEAKGTKGGASKAPWQFEG